MDSIDAFLLLVFVFCAGLFVAAWGTLLPAIGLLWCFGWL